MNGKSILEVMEEGQRLNPPPISGGYSRVYNADSKVQGFIDRVISLYT